MRVEVTDEGGRLVARPEGRLDAADGDDLASAVQQRLTAITKSVTIDLAEVDQVSLAGVRSVLRLARSLKSDRRSLDFVHGHDAVREALKQAGFDELFPFTPPFHSHSHRGIRT